MNKSKEPLMKADWNFRGIVAKIMGWAIIILGILIAFYRHFFVRVKILETVFLIIISLLTGILFLLIGWLYLGDKK